MIYVRSCAGVQNWFAVWLQCSTTFLGQLWME